MPRPVSRQTSIEVRTLGGPSSPPEPSAPAARRSRGATLDVDRADLPRRSRSTVRSATMPALQPTASSTFSPTAATRPRAAPAWTARLAATVGLGGPREAPDAEAAAADVAARHARLNRQQVYYAQQTEHRPVNLDEHSAMIDALIAELAKPEPANRG